MGYFLFKQFQPIVIGPVTIDGEPITEAQVGVPFPGFTVIATGGSGSYTFSNPASAPLPAGYDVNPTTGDVATGDIYTGTPQIFPVIIRVTDNVTGRIDDLSFDLNMTAPATGFVIGDQDVDFGALTTAGAGAYQIKVASGGPLTACSIVAGGTINDSQIVVSPTGVLKRNQSTWPSGTIRISGSNAQSLTDTAILTVNAIPNAYSVLPDPTGAETELKAALSGIGSPGGKTILFRPGTHKPNSSTSAWSNRTYAAFVTYESHDHNNMAIFNGVAKLKSPVRIKFSYLDFMTIYTVAQSALCQLYLSGPFKGVEFDHCTMRGADWKPEDGIANLPPHDEVSLGVNGNAGWHNLGPDTTAGTRRVGLNGPDTLSVWMHDCDFYLGGRLLQTGIVDAANPGYFLIEDCKFHEAASDHCYLQSDCVVFRRNICYGPYAQPGSPAHSDFAQHPNTDGPARDFYIHDNIFFDWRNDGATSQLNRQGPFLQTGVTTHGWSFTRAIVYNNFYLNVGSSIHGTTTSNPVDSQICNNTFVALGSSTGTSLPTVHFEGDNAPVNTIVSGNVAHNVEGQTGPNYEWPDRTDYASIFVGPNFSPDTYIDAIAAFQAKPGGPLTIAGGAALEMGCFAYPYPARPPQITVDDPVLSW